MVLRELDRGALLDREMELISPRSPEVIDRDVDLLGDGELRMSSSFSTCVLIVSVS